MLALARGEGQSIIIDGNIEVKIVKWSRSSVRLAIQAPREVAVDRDEIWRKMHPGQLTPLEKAEIERRERFAREGGVPPHGAATAAPHAPHAAGDGASPPVSITAPVAGIYYASAGPGGSPYVSIGSSVEESSVVASIRTGDQVTDVHAGIRGTVTALPVASGHAVAAGQPLVQIAPGS